MPSIKQCGPSNQIHNILKNVKTLNNDVTLISLSKNNSGSIYEKIKKLGIKIEYFEIRGTSFFKVLSDVKKYIRNERPDIVHSQGILADLVNMLVRGNNNSISTLRNYPYHDYVMLYGKILGRVVALIHLLILQKLKIVICVSSFIKEKFEGKFPDYVIENGVDRDYFRTVSADEKSALRKTLGLNENKKLFICTNDYIPRKDHKTLLNAWTKISNDSQLILLGGNLEHLKAEVHDNVIIVGKVTNVQDYLNASDFFISTSLSEGLPNSVLEALSCGLPCILSDIAPHKEFDPKESVIKYFKTGSSLELENCINTLMVDGDIETNLGVEELAEKFSARNNAIKYVEKYNEICSG